MHVYIRMKKSGYMLELKGKLESISKSKLKLSILNELTKRSLDVHCPIPTKIKKGNEFNNCRDDTHFYVIAKKESLLEEVTKMMGEDITILVTLQRYCYKKDDIFKNGIYLYLKEIR